MEEELKKQLLKVADTKGLTHVTEFCVCSGINLIEAYSIIHEHIEDKIILLTDFYT